MSKDKYKYTVYDVMGTGVVTGVVIGLTLFFAGTTLMS